jgi:hypothetical protein
MINHCKSILILILCICTTSWAQEFTSDTSYVRVREKDVYIGKSIKSAVHLFKTPLDMEIAANPRYGTFIPRLSVSPDSTKAVVVILHPIDAHSYAVINTITDEWSILTGEAYRVYWSKNSKRIAIYEWYPSNLQKIRIVDISVSPLEVITADELTESKYPSDSLQVRFDAVVWNKNGDSLSYSIIKKNFHGHQEIIKKKFPVKVKKKKY